MGIERLGGTRVVAHRGFHGGGVAENSLGAFRRAIDAGADALELDVRRTRDGVLVVHHDPRLADGRLLAQLDFASLPALHDGQPIPRLVDVVELAAKHRARLSVELKEAGHEQLAAAQLTSRLPREQFDVIAFDRSSIRTLEAADPSLHTGMLEPRLPARLRSSALYPGALWVMDRLGWHPSLKAAARIGADYVNVEQRMATGRFLAAARDRGIAVNVWTVNDEATMRRLFAERVMGITTDLPDLALQLRSQSQAAAGAATVAT